MEGGMHGQCAHAQFVSSLFKFAIAASLPSKLKEITVMDWHQ